MRHDGYVLIESRNGSYMLHDDRCSYLLLNTKNWRGSIDHGDGRRQEDGWRSGRRAGPDRNWPGTAALGHDLGKARRRFSA